MREDREDRGTTGLLLQADPSARRGGRNGARSSRRTSKGRRGAKRGRRARATREETLPKKNPNGRSTWIEQLSADQALTTRSGEKARALPLFASRPERAFGATGHGCRRKKSGTNGEDARWRKVAEKKEKGKRTQACE